MTWTLDKWKFLRDNASTMTRHELADAMGVSKASISQQCWILDIKTKGAGRRRMRQERAEQPEPVQPPAPPPEKRKLRPSKYRSAQEERPTMKEKIFTKRYDSKAAADIASLVEDMRQWIGEVMKQYKTTKIPRIVVGENPNDFLHNTLTVKLIIPIES